MLNDEMHKGKTWFFIKLIYLLGKPQTVISTPSADEFIKILWSNLLTR